MIDISNINVGDRVHLTAKNGDEAWFTVKSIRAGYLDSKHNSYYGTEWDTIEVLTPALPTKLGYYEAERFAVAKGSPLYRLTRLGWSVDGRDLTESQVGEVGRLRFVI